MEKFYLILEESGHCEGLMCYRAEILDENQYKELQDKGKVDDEIEADNLEEAVRIFTERLCERFSEKEYEEFMIEFYIR